MSAIVLLSSSPPRAFAPSPTPVTSSSPLPSPSALLKNGISGSQRFKPVSKVRDGFSSGFSNARALLTTKIGAENIPLRSPGKERFKPASPAPPRSSKGMGSQGSKFITEKVGSHTDDELVSSRPVGSQTQACGPNPQPLQSESIDDAPRKDPSNRERRRTREYSPLCLEQALPRRLDWTPVKPSTKVSAIIPEPEVPSLGFSKDLIDNFTYAEPTHRAVHEVATSFGRDGEPTKRRRIDIVVTGTSNAEPSLRPADTLHAKETAKKGSKRRNKSPAKKMLTITGLATSRYGREDERTGVKVAPMLEYLTATQLGAGELDSAAANTASKKGLRPKTGGKKARGGKKPSAQSRLLSPTSAMQAIESQETLFGSASQLAREESPTLLRDTLEALKRSECFWSSDPISPQRTQPVSIESTSPYKCRGTDRFVKKKNLWMAAGRDEDNALLHVDTVDLIDSPAVRQALPGKDVLLQPAEPGVRTRSSEQSGRTDHDTDTPLVNKAGPFIDIDDIVTPGPQVRMRAPATIQARSYHTTRTLEVPSGHTNSAQTTSPEPRPRQVAARATNKPVPTKPCYAGFQTHELQKQISAFGFKPVKKREKMIELLERCWEDKHGVSPGDGEKGEEAPEAMTHGDFLSKVHDVSARPVPKVKKPRAKRKSTDTEPKPAKEPKQRKKAEPKATSKAASARVTKTPRKRTTKKALSEEVVMDVDDIDAETETTTTDPQGQESLTKPAAVKPKTPKSKLTTVAATRAKRPATPPPTLPLINFSSSPAPGNGPREPVADEPTGVEETSDRARLNRTMTAHNLTPDHTPALPEIQSQIHAAIHFRPDARAKDAANSTERNRDHTVSPTWRERILMYDPIVLEDLTVWLNTEGFRAIGEDREVGALEVREWCETNGVCCLWKGGWRGNGHSRASGTASGSGRKGGSGEG
ncbi:hypothetical protein A1O1_07046 [Capronia coronata CBS 617.96]|uniref:Structure-specific endonuclease subunit SLX4 n=1 Tax=Capronia coronata CBS 617.96 TaxID=1182541 RepID=W9XT90_9EURO|nr:uncharacterized protein A1O1_07046 [Capronia coronata CBS 617.96]EXJ83423.1 hypothetical protein A1O1_07046 [Capronia coronata CBS 617.96]